jgi:short-subunit dehydrogenase
MTVYPGPVASDLERRARAQVEKTWASRAIPVGDPRVLAKAIMKGIYKRSPRVIYPTLYGAAAEMGFLTRRFTERFSPETSA